MTAGEATENDGAEAARPAIEDADTRRAFRRLMIRPGACVIVGVGLLVTALVLQVTGVSRQVASGDFREVTGTVLFIDEGQDEVAVSYLGTQMAILSIPAGSSFVEGQFVAVMVDPSDHFATHFPGEDFDPPGSDANDAPPLVAMAGLLSLFFTIVTGWRLWPTRRLLMAHPWRPHPLRWDGLRSSLVGEVEGTWVAYESTRPGTATIDIAGPAAPSLRARSVLRFPDGRLEYSKGPRPIGAPSAAPSGDSGADLLFNQALLHCDRPRWRNTMTVASADGTALASLTRSIEQRWSTGLQRMMLVGGDGSLLLELRGPKVLGPDGEACGQLRLHTRSMDVLLPDTRDPARLGFLDRRKVTGNLVARVDRGDRHRDVIVGVDGRQLGEIVYESSRPSSLPFATVRWLEPIPQSARPLLTAAALTMRWRHIQKGGGA